MYQRIVYLNAALLVFALAAPCQQASSGDSIQPGTPASSANTSVIEPEAKGIFRMLQNYGTAPSVNEFEPLTSAEKFRLASKDAFVPGTYAGAALSAGIAQWKNSNQSFGQGASGYGRYFSAAFADSAIRTYTTEGIFPSILHQDPRYFRRGTGGGWSRLRYAVGQVFWTHGDSGKTEFNLFRGHGELNGSSDVERLLCGSPDGLEWRITAGHKFQRRYGGQHLQGVLAGFRKKIQSKTSQGKIAVCDNQLA